MWHVLNDPFFEKLCFMSVLRLSKSLLALAVLLLGSVLTSCSDTTGNSTTPYSTREIAVSVMTEPARLSDLRETLTSVGTARALKSVSVFAETSGRVTSVLIDADAAVSAGDLLLQLDDRDERPGAKLAAMDLIGIPWQVVVGPRGLDNSVVEVKRRKTGATEELAPASVVSRLQHR